MHVFRTTLLLIVLVAGTALAQTTDEAETTRQLDAVEDGIRLSSARQQDLSDQSAETAKALEDITGQLVSLTSTIQSKENLLTRLDQQLAHLLAERGEIKSDLNKKKAVLSEVLAGLQRLEQNPPPALVVAPDDILSALRGAMMFGAVVPEMKGEANLLIGKLERLAAITAEQTRQRENLATEFASLQKARTELDTLQLEKRKLSLATESDAKTEEARVAALAGKAKTLRQLLENIKQARLEDEARKSAEEKAKAAELERQRQALAKPHLLLSRARGKLDYPVQGSILRQFGDAAAGGKSMDGMAVATRQFAQVKSPVDAKVEFAGPFRSYGHLLILDAGEGYLVLMAGMTNISASHGQSIRAGEPVGQMGDGPSSTTLLGGAVEDSRPVLYVEFRKQGKPVDPAPWWIGGRKEAMR